jgi:hypothetical protein
MTAKKESYRSGEIPDFVEVEFDEWFLLKYPAVPRDANQWGEQFRQIYVNAKQAWIEAYGRGLELNY